MGVERPASTVADVAGALVHLSCESDDFATTVAAIRAVDSVARLRAFADQCGHQEGVVRTPLVLLQLLALVRQYECQSHVAGAPSERATFGRELEAHGASLRTIMTALLHTAAFGARMR